MEQINKESKRKNTAEFWKNLFFHNLAIKLLSCVFAILVWLMITNIADPYKTKNFSVTVQTINEDAISAANMVYEIVEGEVATVSVSGKRSVIDKLESDSIIATADLSDLSSVNAVPIKAKVKGSAGSDVLVECNQMLKISLEDMETKLLKVTVLTKGEPSSDYSVGECVAKPNVIEVRGGESVIDRVDSVGVTVNVNGAMENFTQNVEPVAYDKKGNKISSSTLSFNVSRVKVRVKFLQKKTIPVKIQIKGQPADGYEYVDVTNSPEEIEIAGNKKTLQSVSQLVLPIDISGLKDSSSKLEQNINAEDYLPDGISVPAEEEKNISVKIMIEKQQTKMVSFPISQIKLNHVRNGYVAEVVEEAANIPLMLRGRASLVSSLTSSAISCSVECQGLSSGIYSLPLSLDLGSMCSLAEKVRVRVRIVREVSENSSATEAPEATETPAATETPEPEAE